MVLLVLVLFFCCVYFIWRYSNITNKKLFFKSSLFISLGVSLGILFASVLVINVLDPPGTTLFARARLGADTPEPIDTATLRQKSPEDQWDYIMYMRILGNGSLSTLKSFYGELQRAEDPAQVQLGYFGAGAIAYHSDNYDSAIVLFQKVGNEKFPCVNYGLGMSWLKNQDSIQAKKYFRKELDVIDGNLQPSFQKLIDIEVEQGHYDSVRALLKHPAAEYFPPHTARQLAFEDHDFTGHAYWTFKSIQHETKIPGFIAALAITLIWMIYLIRLNIFSGRKIVDLLLMFIAAILALEFIFLFNDMHEALIPWAIDGSVVGDLLYCIVMIGIPEEFTKLIPVLVAVLLFKPKEPTDYILYAATSALGFAFVENLLYFHDISNGIIHGRAYLSVIAHMVNSSIVVYGFILARFRKKNSAKAWTLVPLTFLAGSAMHGIYDFLLFHSLILPFFLVFIFTVQVWIIMINNSLNNVSNFSYRTAMKADRLKIFIAVSLTSIFALEYLLAGFKMGAEPANTQLIQNAAFAGFFIIFFSSNLSSFNLIRGYWRDIYFSSREKRGYGTMAPRNALSAWYFVNSIQAHNYVGLKVLLYNDPYNRNLEDVLEGKLKGTIVNRIILYDGKDQDPHWFILKLDSLLHIENYHPRYMLVKPRHEGDSLEMDGELQVFFKVIKDPALLRTARPQKEAFPFLGWTYLELVTE